MQSVCLLPDLHFSPPLTADDSIHIQHIRTAVAAQCDLLIYVGDILTMDQCTSIAACASFYPAVRTVVDTIGMPFLFTLGNHDGDPSSAERTQLKAVLNASAHHVGICEPMVDACVHPVLDVATLYSGKEHCHQYTHWGCPSAVQAAWIDAALSARPTFSLLVTHIPPPNVLGLAVDGVVGERVCLVLGCVRRRRRCAAHAPACSPRVWSRSFQSVRECPRVTHQCDVRRCVQVRPSTKLLRRCLPSGFLWLHGPERAHSGRTQCSSPQPNIHIHRGGSGPILCPKGDGHPSEVRSPLMTSDDL